jgi:DNA-binding transcriptional MocR family regulator
MARLRAVHDLGSNVPAQLAAARLLDHLPGLLEPAARQRQRAHDQLLQALARELPTWKARPVTGGQTLWVRLPRGDGASFAQVALRHGVAVLPGTGLDATGGSDRFIRLHFILPADQLDEAVRRLAAAWLDYRPAHNRTTAPPSLAV